MPRSRSNEVQTGHQTFVVDDHRVAAYETVLDPETGLIVQRSIAATDEEIRARELAAMRRGLESVDARIAQADHKLAPWEDDPDEEEIAKRRAGLEAERELLLSKLAQLEPPEPEKKVT
jgi:hypothetical protein